MENSAMKAGRFLRQHKARQRIKWMEIQWDAGKTVYVSTCTRITKIAPKHRDMVKATKTGVYVQRGRAWDCIDFCNISAQ